MNRLSMRTLFNSSPTFALSSTLPSSCAKILVKSDTIRCSKLSAIVSRRTETAVRLFLVAELLLVLQFLQVACHQGPCRLYHQVVCLHPMVDLEHLHRLLMGILPITEVHHRHHLVSMEDLHRRTITSKLTYKAVINLLLVALSTFSIFIN